MKVDFDDNGARVSISGDFTFTDHAAFKAIADRVFEGKDWPIVMDLTKLEFIDSAGLGMLLIIRDEAKKAKRSLVLRGARGQVKRMFDVTKFDTLFTVEA
jgi:anti-anti-sigma factor